MADATRYKINDLVVWLGDSKIHKVTKILPGRIQLDGENWERDPTNLAPATGALPPAKQPKPGHAELRDRWLRNAGQVLYGLGRWRRYDAGYWGEIPEKVIEREIMRVCEDARQEGVSVTAGLVDSVHKLAVLNNYEEADTWDKRANCLVFNNGTLDIDSLEFRNHSQDDYATNNIPYDYDPEATAPFFDYALYSSIPQAADFLQEYAGYCLTTDTSHEIAVWLYGEGGSGKSTIVEGFYSMFGCSDKRSGLAGKLGLADIEVSRFALAGVPGKRLLISTEQPTGLIRASHILNEIISGERITIEEKYMATYEIRTYAHLLWAMNSLPRIEGGANNGIFRRVKVIKFPVRAEAERDTTVKNEVKDEGPGILNWALEGLGRLRKRGRFDVPDCVRIASDAFREENDRPALFLLECCERGDDFKTQSSTLYQSYKSWCLENGHRAASSTTMAAEWERLGLKKSRVVGRSYWDGIRLNGQTV